MQTDDSVRVRDKKVRATKIETTNISAVAKSAAAANDESATPPPDRHSRLRSIVKRRSLWLIGALLVVISGAFGYHWAFGKAKSSIPPLPSNAAT